jgi:hypothetical protein
VIAYTGRFGDGAFGRKAKSKPAPFANGAKGCGTPKFKIRAKTGQLQDDLPQWVHRRSGVISEGKPARGVRKGGPPAATQVTPGNITD